MRQLRWLAASSPSGMCCQSALQAGRFPHWRAKPHPPLAPVGLPQIEEADPEDYSHHRHGGSWSCCPLAWCEQHGPCYINIGLKVGRFSCEAFMLCYVSEKTARSMNIFFPDLRTLLHYRCQASQRHLHDPGVKS